MKEIGMMGEGGGECKLYMFIWEKYTVNNNTRTLSLNERKILKTNWRSKYNEYSMYKKNIVLLFLKSNLNLIMRAKQRTTAFFFFFFFWASISFFFLTQDLLKIIYLGKLFTWKKIDSSSPDKCFCLSCFISYFI